MAQVTTAREKRLLALAQEYYNVLHRIARGYMTTKELQKHAEKHWGLPYGEILEMVYDNIQADATRVIQHRKRPR